MLMLAYLFAQCSHAVGEFSLPAIAASLLSFLSFLSKFREISWGRFFPERKRGATTTTRRNILLPLTNYSFRPRNFFSWGGIFEGKRGRDKFSFLFFFLSRRGESRMEEKTREKAIFSYSFFFCRGLYFETMFHVEKRISGCRTGTKRRIFQRLGLGKRVGKF